MDLGEIDLGVLTRLVWIKIGTNGGLLLMR
jgi:hypothetical protein